MHSLRRLRHDRISALLTGAWRELVANMIVTEGVVGGEAESFPLLYHWRLLPGRAPIASEQLDIDAVVAQFGGSPAVRIRFEELAAATSSLVLFLEYVPDPLLDRLTDPVGQAETLQHVGHDAEYAAMRLVNWLVTTVCGVPVPASDGPVDRNMYVRRCASGDIPQDVPAAVAEILARHAPAAARMNDFCWRLFDGDIHAEYPGA